MDAETGTQWGGDPGWRPSLFVLIPYAVLFTRRKRRDPITTLRDLYLTFVSALALFGFVLSFIAPFPSERNGLGWAIGIGALAVVNLVLVGRVEKPLLCESEEALAGSYRTRLFVRLAFGESTALLGFVAAFTIDGNWIYFLAVLCSVPAFLRLAPTKGAFIRDQDELTNRGCSRSLIAALRTTPPKGK
jgi:F0F1-type ATP synthase membrane subunit c/vacuolar-type H+-ATPase subunit K